MLRAIDSHERTYAHDPTYPAKLLDTKGSETERPVLFNNEEAYKLCVCLETLFQSQSQATESQAL